ncbi:MAG: hypothetical protein Q8Q01_05725 [archaeon]|nr:hypothetical protein [archaeon]
MNELKEILDRLNRIEEHLFLESKETTTEVDKMLRKIKKLSKIKKDVPISELGKGLREEELLLNLKKKGEIYESKPGVFRLI